jgi:hypothetical protein
MRTFEFRRAFALLRERRLLVLACIVVLLSAAGMWLAFFRQANDSVPVSVGEEPCSTGSGGLSSGYAKTIVLCTEESPKCKPDQTQVFRAQPPGDWNAEAMLVPDIPEGYVITGGDLIDPSVYNLRSLGFDHVAITNYANSSDYCTQHYWYYLRANWISSDPSDRVTITACIYYGKWRGAPPTEACAQPTGGPNP